MGKKSKIGKARKDKFYHLAKETGYRARSAFKLLQLNRKYEFLQNSRVCIDLCAAPGGWLQVAAQNMPVSSIIIGVDLVPIKPIQNVKTFTEDITTDKCRVTLRKELHDWKVDCVLNDGAPNVGKNWVQDAFTQAELTLSAMKLATCFLKKGGWFVTKVFRSKDYQSLMWVFSQLFKKVYATKPQASRSESAEIFVVCQGYLAPDKLDEKFTDSKFVFKEVLGGQKKLDILNLKKPKAEGYAEEDTVLYHTLSASKLVKSDNHMELLVNTNEIVLDDDELANHKLTTDELREYMKDVKVLGRREIRLILNWRKKMRLHLAALRKAAAGAGADVVEAEEESEDEEVKTDEMIASMKAEEEKDARKKRKAVLKEKRKLRDKMDLKMIIPGDEGILTAEMDLFNLKKIKKKHDLEHVTSVDLDLDGSASESDGEDEHMPSKIAFDRHNDEYEPDPDGIYTDDDEEKEEDEEEEESDAENSEEAAEAAADAAAPANPLVVELRPKDVAARHKAALWFEKEAFSGVLDERVEEGLELATAASHYQQRGGTVLTARQSNHKDFADKEQSDDDDDDDDDEADDDTEGKDVGGGEMEENDEEGEDGGKRAMLFDEENIMDADFRKKYGSDGDSESDSEADDYLDAHSLVKSNKPQVRAVKNNARRDGFEVVSANEPARKIVKLSPVELAIGEELIKSSKRRREIIEGSYNRYTFNDDELPVWFLKDEQRHCHKQLPVTKSQIEEQKEKLKAINCRPIKKVAEAKARKKRKSVRKLEKVRKKAEAISESHDASDKEKWNQIRQIYSKAGLLKTKKVNVTYVVAKKGAGKKVRRPAGVQGRFRVVDPRMKKDDLGRKKSEKANKGKKKKGGHGGKKR